MYDFLERFIFDITDIYQQNEKEPFPQINKIELSKSLVAAVLSSDNVEFDAFDCVRNNISTVIIPKSFYEYIIHTVNRVAIYVEHDDGNYYDINYNMLYKALSDMLFIK